MKSVNIYKKLNIGGVRGGVYRNMKWSIFQNILSCNYPGKYGLKDFPGLLIFLMVRNRADSRLEMGKNSARKIHSYFVYMYET